ncbi:TetR/AcrR family transcriptional regulator [Tsukamurella sp. 1534]|uniref:TetR/AcrR family transcriptional regulator n=1 Tax=Tsukamurella sp. 1534 TaxID=1151061 RepID=UPI0002F9570E|nr:TetR/AcrR family transcriptional regulator [Tsukamurella sp. 1534]
MTGSRRRGDDLLRAIREAAFAELADKGYGAVTMDSVAARAGTGKAALYRRWPDRDALLEDAVRHGFTLRPAPPFDGDLRGYLVALLSGMARGLDSPAGRAMRAVLGETHRRPGLMDALHEAVFDPRADELRAVVRAAAARGEVPEAAAESPAAVLGPELVMFRFLTDGRLPPDGARSIVDDVVMPLLRAA